MAATLLQTGPFASPVLDPNSQAAQTVANPPPISSSGTSAGMTATAESAHQALIGIGLAFAFVIIAVMLAGVSNTWGTSMIVLMIALLALRGLFDVDTFASFAQSVTKPLNRT